jgi:hypothetical protein
MFIDHNHWDSPRLPLPSAVENPGKPAEKNQNMAENKNQIFLKKI